MHAAVTSHQVHDLIWSADWVHGGLRFALIFGAAVLLQIAIVGVVSRASATWHPLVKRVFTETRTGARFAFLVVAAAATLPALPLSPEARDESNRWLGAAFILLLGWALFAANRIISARYISGYRLDAADNLLARKAVTQLRILKRAVDAIIVLVTAGLTLMTFNSVRQFGISLFASAGVAGIVAGVAARPVLSNLVAGLQLAFAQPIRIEDAVVIQNEWGWIEEIGSLFVVVRLWDWRRLVVPLSYFFENPFQNWTRTGAALIGSVYLYLDWSVPIEPLRRKLEEIAKASKLWDGQVVNLQVSDAKEGTIEVRALMSARNSSDAWDLRCEVREKLITFIQREYPHGLPQRRNAVFLRGDNTAGTVDSPGEDPSHAPASPSH